MTEGYSFSFYEVSIKPDKESTRKQICWPVSLVIIEAKIVNRIFMKLSTAAY